MILHFRALRDLYNVLKKFIKEEEIDNFIKDLLNAKGTNSSFKLVFKELSEYIKMKSDTKE